MTYRAAWLATPAGDCVPLTGPDEAHMTDDQLRAAAFRQALRAGIYDDSCPNASWPHLSRIEFDEQLTIGDWPA
jgi:hypothetical protein